MKGKNRIKFTGKKWGCKKIAWGKGGDMTGAMGLVLGGGEKAHKTKTAVKRCENEFGRLGWVPCGGGLLRKAKRIQETSWRRLTQKTRGERTKKGGSGVNYRKKKQRGAGGTLPIRWERQKKLRLVDHVVR